MKHFHSYRLFSADLAEKIQEPSTGKYHQSAKELPHGKGEKHKTDLGIGLTEVFNDKTYSAIAHEVEREHRPRKLHAAF